MIVTKQFLQEVALPLAEAAYLVESDTPTLPEGYTLVSTIKLQQPLGKLSRDNPYFGFIAVNQNGDVFVSVRGTKSLDEWVEDFDIVLEDVGGFKVCRGFQRVFEALLPSLRLQFSEDKPGNLYVIGHSLGAAIALLFAANIGADVCITFAAPRVGDASWAVHCNRYVGTIVRVTNTKDIITHQVARPLCAHPGKALAFDGWKYFSGLEAKLNAHNEHSLTFAYTPGVAGSNDPLELVELS